MESARILREIRQQAGLSVRGLAGAAGVSASTVHRIEKSELAPTVEMLQRLAAATGVRLELTTEVDYSLAVAGLARSISDDICREDESIVIRKAAELVRRFHSAAMYERRRMIVARPPATGDLVWDAFLGALGEWLALTGDLEVPNWVHDHSRYLHQSVWLTPLKSMQAWEYAGSPASFQSHGVYVHRDSLVNV